MTDYGSIIIRTLGSIILAMATFANTTSGAISMACLGVGAVGCGPTAWNAKHVNTEMGTQFEIGYVSESKIIIGFPGKVTAKGNASGEYVPAPTTTPMPVNAK